MKCNTKNKKEIIHVMLPFTNITKYALKSWSHFQPTRTMYDVSSRFFIEFSQWPYTVISYVVRSLPTRKPNLIKVNTTL